ncbi:hypothetical protein HXX76_011314 [Chlamydomonas incerta]|uniref:Jacalin-type lectin domain-containing protein n=1 Tax=Chlamydomonas incerta TaxID=51695 RepID=A0A835VXE6_CHLIN|nr:hypothetical protein HXX76_011314 [Chlamydomonas incerta]|eukprot:KAG2429074.1 hypothetical protein HXX76_011314 [Chlamydomonas incerta]
MLIGSSLTRNTSSTRERRLQSSGQSCASGAGSSSLRQGPYGGGPSGAAAAFDDAAWASSGAAPIAEVAVLSGSWIDSIQVRYGDAWAPRRGGGGSSRRTSLVLTPGETIVWASVRYGQYVDGITLRTSRGREKKLGADGVPNSAVATPCMSGQPRLLYITGISKTYLEAITFVWASGAAASPPPPLPPPSPPPRPPPPSPCATGSARAFLQQGPYGQGPSGALAAFDDGAWSAAKPISEVTVMSGNWIDSIQVRYGDTWAPRRGGAGGGTKSSLVLSPGESIVWVSIRYGQYVDGMTVRTSAGRQQVLGTEGVPNSAVATPCVSSGQPRLLYITGISKTYLEAITFVWASGAAASPPPPLPPPSPPPRPPPPSPCATGSARASLQQGPYGQGPSGALAAFDDGAWSAAKPISEVTVMSGNWIDSIQVRYGDTWAPRRGGAGGGTKSSLVLSPGESIVWVSIRYGQYVDGMTVRTSAGRQQVLGTEGVPNSAVATPCVSSGQPRLLYITGISKTYLEAITFVWASGAAASPPPPLPPPSPPPRPPPPSPCATGSARASLQQGPYGQGPSGALAAFDDGAWSAAKPISEVTVMSGNWIDSIQVRYGDTWAPRRGGAGGGTKSSLVLSHSEFIVWVSIRYGKYVDGMTVRTSAGRQQVLGTEGVPNSAVATPCASSGQQPRLLYITGVAASYLEAITFVWTDMGVATPQPSPPRPSPPPPLPAVVIRAPEFLVLGAFGGGGDTAFMDEEKAPAGGGSPLGPRLTGIRVYAGSWIDAIQVSFNGVWGPRRGGGGGSTISELLLAEGEVVTSASVVSGAFVDAVLLSTSLNRSVALGPGRSSAAWAAPCPPGAYQLVGLRGTAGTYLSQVSLVWRLRGSAAAAAQAAAEAEAAARAAGWRPGGKLLPQFDSAQCGGSSGSGSDWKDPTQWCPRATGLLGLPAPSPPTPIRVAALNLDVCDTGAAMRPADVDKSLYDDPYGLERFWGGISRGRAYFNRSTSFVRTVKLPCSAFKGNECKFNDWVNYVDAHAAELGLTDWSSYSQRRLWIVPKATGCTDIGFQAGNNIYVRGDFGAGENDYLNVFKHELGHSLGLGHSGRGTNSYGDSSDPMGYCQRCSYNAPHLLQLGWVSPLATLTSQQLPAAGTTSAPWLLPALADVKASAAAALVIWPDWLDSVEAGGAPTFGAAVVSYRTAVGQDSGLPGEHNGYVHVHRVPALAAGGDTWLEVLVAPGASAVVEAARLVVRVEVQLVHVAGGDARGARVWVCRYAASANECGAR